MPRALVSLGSNLGDRRQSLALALAELKTMSGVRLLRRSRWFRSSPVGGPAGQDEFLNGAALIETMLPPHDLLDLLQRIESLAARSRRVRWSARTLDVDLVLYDQLQFEDDRLTLPHPRMTCRRFVLEPAAAIAPHMVDPSSRWTVTGLARQLHVGRRVVIAAATDELRHDLADSLRHTDALAASNSPVPIGAPRSVEPLPPRFYPDDVSLLLAVRPPDSSVEADARRHLGLPRTGPVTWLAGRAGVPLVEEAAAAIAAAHTPVT